MPTVAFDSEGLGPKEELVTSPLRLASLIRQLNGRNRTIVTIIAGGAKHMSIGGDAASGVVVYATTDNRIFHQLCDLERHGPGKVTVVAGGQPGSYERRHVVSVETAIAAAAAFMTTGAFDRGQSWEQHPRPQVD